MAKILEFKRPEDDTEGLRTILYVDEADGKVKSRQEDCFDDRVKKIKYNLDQINDLLGKLKDMKKENNIYAND